MVAKQPLGLRQEGETRAQRDHCLAQRQVIAHRISQPGLCGLLSPKKGSCPAGGQSDGGREENMASPPIPGLGWGWGDADLPWGTTTEMLFQFGWFRLVERGLQPDWQRMNSNGR